MTARKLLIEQRRTLTYTVGGYLGISILLGLFLGYFSMYPNGGNLMLYIFLAGMACAFAASKMMFELTSKEGRTSLLMSPDTAANKFIVRLIAILPGMLILVAVGYIAYAYSDLLMNGISNDIWLPLKNPFNGVPSEIIIMTVSFFLFNEAVFIFGATAWPRKSFIKTVGLLALIQIALSFAMAGIYKIFVASGWSIEIVNGDAFFWCICTTITIVSAAIMYAAYIKFKRSQVV